MATVDFHDPKLSDEQRTIVDAFHALLYERIVDPKASPRFGGFPILKTPMDIWALIEVITISQPDLIIETGTYLGGSAFLMSCFVRLYNPEARVITIDFEERSPRPDAPNLAMIQGGTLAPATHRLIRSVIRPEDKVMVVLDSDHSREHVLREMVLYAPYVTPGQYMIVEDGNVNGHPIWPEHGPGPSEAIADFLAADDRFVLDRSFERFLITSNPKGYLKRR